MQFCYTENTLTVTVQRSVGYQSVTHAVTSDVAASTVSVMQWVASMKLSNNRVHPL